MSCWIWPVDGSMSTCSEQHRKLITLLGWDQWAKPSKRQRGVEDVSEKVINSRGTDSVRRAFRRTSGPIAKRTVFLLRFFVALADPVLTTWRYFHVHSYGDKSARQVNVFKNILLKNALVVWSTFPFSILLAPRLTRSFISEVHVTAYVLYGHSQVTYTLYTYARTINTCTYTRVYLRICIRTLKGELSAALNLEYYF
jgi:hypothetical protein